MTNLVETLINSAVKSHDLNGNPVYKMEVGPIIDSGMGLEVLRKRGKELGMRIIGRDTVLRVQSYNLRYDLNNLLGLNEAK